MKVTVREVLQMDILKEAKVLAGESGLDVRIRNASVLEGLRSDEISSYAGRTGELVISGFFHIKDDIEEQCAIVRALAQKGCAALVLMYVGDVLPEVSDELIDAAEKAGLPLISLEKEGVCCSDVARDVSAELVYGDSFGNRLISNTVFHLLNFEKHPNFQEALKEAAINNDFQIIILSEDFNPILSVETRHRVSIDEAIRIGRSREMNASSVYTLVEVDGVLTYWGSVLINDEKHYMFIVDNEDCYSANEITKLAEIIELAMGMWKYTPERDARAELIKALKRGSKSLAYSLKEEAGINDENILCVFYAHGIETPEARKIIDDFEQNEKLRIMKVAEGDDTYGLILTQLVENDEDAASKRNKCNDLFNDLKAENAVRIFNVIGVEGIEGAADAYRLIGETWSFVQSVFPYKRVFTKYEMVLVSNCINIQLQGGYVKKNHMDLLEPFKEVGEHKGRQLLETLETFVLDAGMNSAKTSEFMGIHTNTVQYRLKKINDVLSAEITGNRVIPGLTIALALKRLDRVVK